MNRHTGFEWTEARRAELAQLWSTGRSAADIGREMKLTKNAVIGKARRLGLPGRPSPIHKDRPPRPRRASPAPAQTLPPLALPPLPPLPASIAAPKPAAPPRPAAAAPVSAAPVSAAPLSAATPPAPPAPAAAPAGCVIACCWPIGDPGTRSFRFCDAHSAPGRPYCAEHCSVAYVRVKDRREDAAEAAA